MATIRTAIQLQDRFTPVIRNMSNALNMTLSSFEALQRASHNAVDTASIQAARQSLASAEVGINEIEQGIREANGQQQQFNNTVRGGGSAIDSMAGKIKSMVGAYIGIRSLGAGMQATDTYVSNNARLDLINDGLQTQAELQDKIYQAAQRSRGEYNAMVNTVAKLGLLAGDAFGSNDELIAFTELMNKSFKISGASTQESTNAMYQLTQAMASGRLQGDEYRSIIENAPMLANAIAEYCDVSRGELKELASDGAISADIIKAAVFATADDIEGKFATLPMTFSDVWSSIKNTAVQQFSELMQKVNGFLNSNIGKNMIMGISNAIGTMAMVLGAVFDMVIDISTFFFDNWSTIEPIIWGIVGAFAAYELAVKMTSIALGISSFMQQIHAVSTAIAEGATWRQAAAQHGLNAALLASPYTWIIIGIAAVVAAIVWWVNKVGGIKIAWMITSAYLMLAWDLLKIAFIKGIYSIGNFLDALVLAWQSASTAVQNWCGDMKVGALNILQNMVNGAIDIINGFINTLNSIPGVSIETIEHLTFATEAAAKNEADKQARNAALEYQKENLVKQQKLREENLNNMKDTAQELFTIRMQEVWSAQAEINANSAAENDPKNNMPDYSSMGQNLDNIAGDTGKMSDSLDTSEEDLKYLRDIAEQEAINRFTTAEIKVDMGGVNNTVNNNADLDGIVDYLASKVEEQMQIAAEGVHE